MKKYILLIIWLAVISAFIYGMCGCATFEYKDKDCTIKTTTIGKDIVIDPNGVMSTVSPKNQGIIEAAAGFVAGLFAAGL